MTSRSIFIVVALSALACGLSASPGLAKGNGGANGAAGGSSGGGASGGGGGGPVLVYAKETPHPAPVAHIDANKRCDAQVAQQASDIKCRSVADAAFQQ
jgi:hypothetical protein